MKTTILCVLVVLIVGVSYGEQHGGRTLFDTLGYVAGFAPGHEGHQHGPSGKAGCRGSTTAAPAPTTVRTTAAG